jgi:hypothetical protein
VSKQLVYA